MKKVTYPLVIGQKTYLIEEDVATMQDFFEKIAPMLALEIETAGMTDVYLSFRITKKGDKYFSLIRPNENTEFHLGCRKDQPGTLFPGKYDKASQSTKREWTSIQCRGNLTGDDDDDDGTSNNNMPAQQSAAQSGNVVSISNRPLTDEQLQQRAKTLAAGGAVSYADGKYDIHVNDKTSYSVVKGRNGKPTCNCERFKVMTTSSNPDFRCEHLRAVAIFANTPPKPSSSDELKLLISDLLEAGMIAEDIDTAIARVCDGRFAVEELSAAQTAKAIRSLSTKLDHVALKSRVAEAVA